MTEQEKPRSGSEKLRRGIIAACALLVCIIALVTALSIARSVRRQREKDAQRAALLTQTTVPLTTTTVTTTTERYPSAATRGTETITVADTELLRCRNAALIEVLPQGNRLIAERDADAVIYPASLTKLMTLVTFLEKYGENRLDETVAMEPEVLSEAHARLAACTGLQGGELCTVRDLLYGLMLPSGADAAYMLARLAAGSEEGFVKMMNANAEKMGLTHTNYINCTGLHDPDHVSTVQDIARLLCYAMRDPFCRELMQTPQYLTASTAQHPQGVSLISTVLSRMSGAELTEKGYHLRVQGGKTGFTNEAGQCLASFAADGRGKQYICVVAGCDGKEPMDAVYDTLTLYQLTERPLSGIDRYLPPDLIEETTVFSGIAGTGQ